MLIQAPHTQRLTGALKCTHDRPQVFQACAQVQNQVGLANAGIASDVSARLHKTQGIYS
jgi:hypothetical protein